MEEEKRKFPLSSFEVVCLAIILPVIYLGSVLLIYGKEYHLPWRIVYIVAGEAAAITIILAFDVVWVIMVLLRAQKRTRTKLILTLLVLTLSAIALTDLFFIYSWRIMW